MRMNSGVCVCITPLRLRIFLPHVLQRTGDAILDRTGARAHLVRYTCHYMTTHTFQPTTTILHCETPSLKVTPTAPNPLSASLVSAHLPLPHWRICPLTSGCGSCDQSRPFKLTPPPTLRKLPKASSSPPFEKAAASVNHCDVTDRASSS